MTSEEKAGLVLEAMDEKKAVNPVKIEVRGRTVMTDVLVVASGNSNVHIRSIADAIIEKLRDNGMKSKRLAGYEQATWILLDYGDVIVHVFAPEEREFYRLEAYWSGAEKGSPPPMSPEEVG
jgi:ribosome-associated protein